MSDFAPRHPGRIAAQVRRVSGDTPERGGRAKQTKVCDSGDGRALTRAQRLGRTATRQIRRRQQ